MNLKHATAFGTFLSLVSIAILSGCATAPKEPNWSPLKFPQPPAQARVQYLGGLASPGDLPNRRSTFADFILGPKQEVNLLAKPNNAVLSGNRLFIGDTVQNTVFVYNLETGDARPLLGDRGNGKIQQPNDLAIAPDGRLFVADKLRRAILIYSPEEEFIDAWGGDEDFSPVSLAMSDDLLYICDIDHHEVEAWSMENGEFQFKFGGIGTKEHQMAFPTSVAVGPEGNVYVTDTGHCRIQKFTAQGEFISAFGRMGNAFGEFAWPKGMDVDGYGRIYVADTRFANVQIFDNSGRLLLFFGGPGADRGNLDLPGGLDLFPWPSIPWLAERVEPDFDPEFLAIVVNQVGPVFVNFYAVARDEDLPASEEAADGAAGMDDTATGEEEDAQ